MTEERLRVSVVGLGKMGILHSCILNVLPQVQLVALCEKTSLTRRLLKKIFKNVQIVDDVEKLGNLDLDAVYITTPIPFHYPVARVICSKNIARNLFVEKTLASNYEEAKELCQSADAIKGTNMVGYLRRFYVTFKKAKELLSEDAIGRVSSFKAYGYSSDFLGVKDGTAIPASRGGVLMDLGCHIIDLALWYFGDFLTQSADIESLTASDSEDAVHFVAKNSDGVEGQFDISWCMDNYRMPEVGMSITGSKGVLAVNDDKVEVLPNAREPQTWYRHDLNDNVPFWLALPEYYREDALFIEAVRKHHPVEPSIETASKVDQMIDQVKRRAR